MSDINSNLTGRLIDEKYELKKMIGGGQFGHVYLADELLNGKVLRRVALKLLKSEEIDGEKLREQFNDCTFPALILDQTIDINMKKHFVQIYNWGFTEVDCQDRAYIAMEFVPDAEDLRATITRQQKTDYYPDPAFVENIMKQLFTGLSLAHGKNVIHRDLKPENLLLSHDVLRIVDFGLSIELARKSGFVGNMAGTYMYMAPENFMGYYHFSSDVYSAGLVIYELWTNRHPFEYIKNQIGPRSEDNRIISYEARKGWRYVKGKKAHSSVRDSEKIDLILEKCLKFNLEERYSSADEVLGDVTAYLPQGVKEYHKGLEEFNRKIWSKAVSWLSKANDSYDEKDEIKFNILETLGYALVNMGKEEKALQYLLAAYHIDEEKLILTKDIERRSKLLLSLSQCYSDLGQANAARIYKKKVDTHSGQGR